MPNTNTVITAVAGLNANQTSLLQVALTRTIANRDVVRVLKTGSLAADGDASYSAISTAAGFLVWMRTKATKAEALALHKYLYKQRAGLRLRTRMLTGQLVVRGIVTGDAVAPAP